MFLTAGIWYRSILERIDMRLFEDIWEMIKAVSVAGFVMILAGGFLVLFIGLGYWLVHDPVQEAADAVPRIIADVDSCKVYQFKSNGSWHYFTRCEATTVTTRNYTESCGKACTRNRTEEISTENK